MNTPLGAELVRARTLVPTFLALGATGVVGGVFAHRDEIPAAAPIVIVVSAATAALIGMHMDSKVAEAGRAAVAAFDRRNAPIPIVTGAASQQARVLEERGGRERWRAGPPHRIALALIVVVLLWGVWIVSGLLYSQWDIEDAHGASVFVLCTTNAAVSVALTVSSTARRSLDANPRAGIVLSLMSVALTCAPMYASVTNSGASLGVRWALFFSLSYASIVHSLAFPRAVSTMFLVTIQASWVLTCTLSIAVAGSAVVVAYFAFWRVPEFVERPAASRTKTTPATAVDAQAPKTKTKTVRVKFSNSVAGATAGTVEPDVERPVERSSSSRKAGPAVAGAVAVASVGVAPTLAPARAEPLARARVATAKATASTTRPAQTMTEINVGAPARRERERSSTSDVRRDRGRKRPPSPLANTVVATDDNESDDDNGEADADESERERERERESAFIPL